MSVLRYYQDPGDEQCTSLGGMVFGHGWIRRAGDAGCFVGGVVEFSPFASVISIGTRESSGKIANDIGDRTLSAWTWYGTLPIAGVIRTWPVGNVLYLRSVDPKHRQGMEKLRLLLLVTPMDPLAEALRAIQ